jgi:indolepyruvate ferredoxin oxidoreductase alpha subunit
VKKLLSGNDAIARGAYENGVVLASAYPATPSTEILEKIVNYEEIQSEWSPNEKVALDVAIGGAYAGGRSIAVMKHVGLNVAADSFFYASMTGAEAGLLIVCADDPAMHSSQNEQDTRRYCKFARVPCLEPTDSQEAKDLVGVGLSISEEFDTPVLLRITTRIAHSHSLVFLGKRTNPDNSAPHNYRVDPSKYVMAPGNARRRHPIIEERIKRIQHFAESFKYNKIEKKDSGLGIISNGISYQYAKEIFPNASILKLGMTYPIAPGLVLEFASQVERLIVIEELDPFIEEEIHLLGINVEGGDIYPRIGEFNPSIIRENSIKAGLLPKSSNFQTTKPRNIPRLPLRFPILCPGCPHRGVFVITDKMKLVVNGDIGCYTLGFLPPLSALHTCGCMGASVGVAHGANKVGINPKNVAVLGDSTFFHTGIPALLNTAYNKSNTVTIILDNHTTAMTGHQENPSTGKKVNGESTFKVDFLDLGRSLGIEHRYKTDPYDLKQTEAAIRDAISVEGPALVVADRACALLPEVKEMWRSLEVETERCNGCGLCFRVGCPALIRSGQIDSKTKRNLAEIDPLICTGCSICAQLCARGAIH